MWPWSCSTNHRSGRPGCRPPTSSRRPLPRRPVASGGAAPREGGRRAPPTARCRPTGRPVASSGAAPRGGGRRATHTVQPPGHQRRAAIALERRRALWRRPRLMLQGADRPLHSVCPSGACLSQPLPTLLSLICCQPVANLLPACCQPVARQWQPVATMLPTNCQSIANVFQPIANLLPACCQTVANLLPTDCQPIAPLVPTYCQPVADLLPACCRPVADPAGNGRRQV